MLKLRESRPMYRSNPMQSDCARSFYHLEPSVHLRDMIRAITYYFQTTPGESLPMDFEEYDDALMAHKSVLRMRSNPTSSSNMSRQQVESVTKWLKKIPSGPGALDADVSSLMAEFDVIKNSSTPEAEVESTDSASSFDIIAPKDGAVPETPVEKVLSAEFLNVRLFDLKALLV
ncbi:unnamed protein product [Cylicostephanus goldi]|uniref:Uncharacterized protein n=1 Tax=Cylicostephanus goldi TaxID=71465 RepID=A0A3P7R5Z8_CYLGO|nr:unnamed protein product [Cylicostephanus goldi]